MTWRPPFWWKCWESCWASLPCTLQKWLRRLQKCSRQIKASYFWITNYLLLRFFKSSPGGLARGPERDKGPESLREQPQRPLACQMVQRYLPMTQPPGRAVGLPAGSLVRQAKAFGWNIWEERSGRRPYAWVMPDSSLTPVLLSCLILLELLQACVGVGPRSPFLQQKSGRALFKAAKQRKNIYRQEGNLVSPHPLAE